MTERSVANAAGRGVGHFAYLFEAKGIQRYIFDSGKLRDLIGASDLIAELAESRDGADDLIGRVLKALGVREKNGNPGTNEVEFSRRAGGAFVMHSSDERTLHRVRAFWRLAAAVTCPGLEMSDTRPIGGEDPIAARRAAFREVSAVRTNTAAELPPAGHPFAAFNPRTGRLATEVRIYGSDIDPADALTQAHRTRADASKGPDDGVAARFLGEHTCDENGRAYIFPRNLEPEEDTADNPAFPFEDAERGIVDDRRRVAVVHADISGLGQVFQTLSRRLTAIHALFDAAKTIEGRIAAAAQEAVREVLRPWAVVRGDVAVVPARPIVLGGDDLTVLVRGDLAIEFAEVLLRRIEVKTKGILDDVPWLSACAGVAVVGAGQPFQMAHELAESLCKFAKKSAKATSAPFPSMLAFHNAQSTMQEDYGAVLEREKVTPFKLRLTGNPYLIGGASTEATPRALHALRGLATALSKEPRGRGKLVELRDYLATDEAAALEIWRRWCEVMEARNPSAYQGVVKALSVYGVRIEGKDVKNVPLPICGEHHRYCPIPDALEWIDFGADVAKTMKAAP